MNRIHVVLFELKCISSNPSVRFHVITVYLPWWSLLYKVDMSYMFERTDQELTKTAICYRRLNWAFYCSVASPCLKVPRMVGKEFVVWTIGLACYLMLLVSATNSIEKRKPSYGYFCVFLLFLFIRLMYTCHNLIYLCLLLTTCVCSADYPNYPWNLKLGFI